MSYLQWSDDFSVKVKQIDTQHKCLVNMINTLHEALVSKRGRELQKKIVNEMVDYAILHFATEEKFMRLCNYPDLAVHKKEHDLFSSKAADLKARIEKNGSVLTLEVLNYLKAWLQDHILITDKKYEMHFQACGLH